MQAELRLTELAEQMVDRAWPLGAAKVSLSPSRCASAMNSMRPFAGTEGCTKSSASAVNEIVPTGTKSLRHS
jgi:hypothetical protein